MSRLMILVCVCMLSAGCASTGGLSRTNTERPTSGLDTLAQLPLQDTLVFDGSSYTLIDRYVAASNRDCARLRGDNSEIRIACADPAGHWYLRESLLQSSNQPKPSSLNQRSADDATKLPAADDYDISEQNNTDASTLVIAQPPKSVIVPLTGVDVSDASANPDATRVAVKKDETLWRFAKRVTGNALNWEKIAAFNGIGDAVDLKAGQLLAIPADLTVVGTSN